VTLRIDLGRCGPDAAKLDDKNIRQQITQGQKPLETEVHRATSDSASRGDGVRMFSSCATRSLVKNEGWKGSLGAVRCADGIQAVWEKPRIMGGVILTQLCVGS
jgi:hypothetical protein